MTTQNKEPVLALMGNPNVGKSTLFNALTGMHQHTGNWPGKTVAVARGTFATPGGRYTLVDLPGTYSVHPHSAEEEVARDFLCDGEAAGCVVVCDATCLERNLHLALQVMTLCPKVLLCLNLMDEAARKGILINTYLLAERLGVPVVGVTARKKSSLSALCRAIDDWLARPAPVPPSVEDPVAYAEALCRDVVTVQKSRPVKERWDRFFTGRYTAYPVMLVLLAGVLWLTIVGANYPSALLSQLFTWLEGQLTAFMVWAGAPAWLVGALAQGAFRVLGWVVAVMLPPMAIFFPLFTLLEDVGLLPRIAYNLDHPFQRCHACGKQALTMCMGFGCNAAGVVGCRIIDSPRERMIAILTNNFVPCNGRFPTLITLITLFFVGVQAGALGSVWSALALTALILLGILATLGVSRLLSATLLRGVPSSFTLELPPYRRPQVGKVLVRSILDRTLFVLGRAAAVAAPAGLLLWVLANTTVGDGSILQHLAAFLDPFGRLLGMDGVILVAFVLGFPANEIVLPIILMAYLSQGTLTQTGSLPEIGAILTANGWTWVTALCTMVFSLFHWPCSTTLLTIKKETGSWGWTAVGALLPTAVGMVLCMLLAALF